MGNENGLKEVSDKTITDILHEEVVLPSLYGDTFQNNAKELGIEYEIDSLVKSLASDDLELAKHMISEANNHLENLHGKTTDASEAIAQKDDKKLGEISADILKMKQEISFLREQLYTDALTKVKNRKWLSERFIDKDGKMKSEGVMVFADLNSFKAVNDTYGHVVGDKVLIFVANFFKKTVGNEGYSIIRYAGDEFVMIKEGSSEVDPVSQKFDSLQKAMVRKKLKAPSGDILTASFSYGIKEFGTKDRFRDIIEAADKSMYENKQMIKSKMKD